MQASTGSPEPSTALERQQSAGIVRAVSSDDLASALGEYVRIQSVIDRALPDCIMSIQGRSFRKKAYWRAVTTAFNLAVELDREEIREVDGALAVLAIYRATSPNGRVAYGDGACVATEKRKGQDTLHNIRSHAHTRAFNRAVSNLVGFGEVSAEEVDKDGTMPDEPDYPKLGEVRLSAGRALKNGWTKEEVREVLDAYGGTFTHENGQDRLTGMPEDARQDAITALAEKAPHLRKEEPAEAPKAGADPKAEE